METLRTFIAIDLPDQVREDVSRLQQRLMRQCAGVRWVKPAAMHLTLKFLGPTRHEQVAVVAGALAQTACGQERFVFDLAGVGAFPNSRNPKVIWLGIRADVRLSGFHQRLEAALEPFGFPREKRPFAPHLTLGRVRDGAERRELGPVLEAHAGTHIGRVEASRVVFFRSELTPDGPVYTMLGQAHLTPPPDRRV